MSEHQIYFSNLIGKIVAISHLIFLEKYLGIYTYPADFGTLRLFSLDIVWALAIAFFKKYENSLFDRENLFMDKANLSRTVIHKFHINCFRDEENP